MSYSNGPAPQGGGGRDYNGQYPPPYPAYYAPPPPNPWYKPVRRNANIACLGLILVVVLGVFISVIFSDISRFFISSFNIERPEIVSLIEISSEFITYVLMFIIPLAIIRLWIGIPSRIAFPMRPPRTSIALPAVLICLGASVLGAICYGIIAVFLSAAFNIEPIMPQLPDPVGIPAVIVYILWLTAAPSILEELMFRGVIMQSLRRFGDMFALVCSSILFSLAHHNLVQGPNAFLLGMVIGFFTLRTGSLRTGMLMHFTINMFAIVIELLSRDMVSRQAEILSFSMFAFYVLSGIIGLAIIISAHGGIFHLSPSNYPLTSGKKYAAFFLNAAPIIYIIGAIVLTAMQFVPANR